MEYISAYYGFDWISATCALLGIYYLGSNKRSGFILMFLAAVTGMVFAVLAKTLSLILLNVIFIFLHARGYLNWGKEQKVPIKE